MPTLPFRVALLGPSGSGKTQLIQSMLCSRINIWSPSVLVDSSQPPARGVPKTPGTIALVEHILAGHSGHFGWAALRVASIELAPTSQSAAQRDSFSGPPQAAPIRINSHQFASIRIKRPRKASTGDMRGINQHQFASICFNTAAICIKRPSDVWWGRPDILPVCRRVTVRRTSGLRFGVAETSLICIISSLLPGCPSDGGRGVSWGGVLPLREVHCPLAGEPTSLFP